MDFQTFLKDKEGYDTIFMIVNQLSKQPVSMLCYKTTDAADIAKLFMKNIYQHQGLSETIVSD